MVTFQLGKQRYANANVRFPRNTGREHGTPIPLQTLPSDGTCSVIGAGARGGEEAAVDTATRVGVVGGTTNELPVCCR